MVWLAFDHTWICRKAKNAIDDARENADGLAISQITLLELVTLVTKGRIRIDFSLESGQRSDFLKLAVFWPQR